MYAPFRQIFTVTGDVTVKEDVQRIMDSVVGHYGKLDVLVSASATRARVESRYNTLNVFLFIEQEHP